jgi:hypothetical protein
MAQGGCLHSCLGKRKEPFFKQRNFFHNGMHSIISRYAAQAYVAALSSHLHAQHPALAASRFYKQHQSVAVAMPTRLRVFDLLCCEFAHFLRHSLPHFALTLGGCQRSLANSNTAYIIVYYCFIELSRTAANSNLDSLSGNHLRKSKLPANETSAPIN